VNAPEFRGIFRVAADISCLTSVTPVPGFGILPVSAYLIEGAQPVLVDAGLPAFAGEMVAAVASRIDPADLRWIFVTHCDADHVGALEALLDAAPDARIVTNYLGMGKLSMRMAASPDRFYLLNPGQDLDIGDRSLRALSMPSYDAPETMGLFDPMRGALFSSDCFGALLPESYAADRLEDLSAIAPRSLAAGLATWSSVDAPWLASVSDDRFRAALGALVELDPALVLGAHLPPARDRLRSLARQLDLSRSAAPFVGPDQAALEAMFHAAA
jgi:glyoxylase-like metal-dependent hydrolase (beta-lactamase superfamily II)